MNRVVFSGVSIACAFLAAVADQYSVLDRAFSSVRAAVPDEKTECLLLAIEGMHCTSCASGIKAMLKRTPGIISADVSYERREADVTYDPSKVSQEKIIQVITNLGYKAKIKERPSESAAVFTEALGPAAGNT